VFLGPANDEYERKPGDKGDVKTVRPKGAQTVREETSWEDTEQYLSSIIGLKSINLFAAPQVGRQLLYIYGTVGYVYLAFLLGLAPLCFFMNHTGDLSLFLHPPPLPLTHSHIQNMKEDCVPAITPARAGPQYGGHGGGGGGEWHHHS
jgi:hypothetical protein